MPRNYAGFTQNSRTIPRYQIASRKLTEQSDAVRPCTTRKGQLPSLAPLCNLFQIYVSELTPNFANSLLLAGPGILSLRSASLASQAFRNSYELGYPSARA